MLIGSRIREARKDAKMTQGELASKVGMSQAAISELETGESTGTTIIATFASVLGVNALWLETGKGDKHGQAIAAVTGHRETRMILAYEDEEVLLDLYRRSDERGKLNIIATARRGAGDATVDSSNQG